MAKIPDGCVLLARKIKKSDIWQKKPSWWLKAWVYMLMQVNHTDNKLFRRGQNFFTRDQIHDECKLYLDGIKAHTVDNVIRWLRTTTQITTQKTTRGIIITVCNYDYYQDLLNYKNDTENDASDDLKTTQKRHRNDTINNNDKNGKNVNNPPTPLKGVYLENKEFGSAWQGFLEMRHKIRKPATHRAQELLLKKLHAHPIETAIAMLEQSIVHSWQDVYEVKQEIATNRPMEIL